MNMFSKLMGGIMASATMLLIAAPEKASAGDSPFIGEIMFVPYTFCPRDFAEANGQILAINSYTALFSLLGTNYGGDGLTSFGLPDLRGRTVIHTGTGPGLTNRPLAQSGGAETQTLTTAQMPSHNHTVNAANGLNGFSDHKGPANDYLGAPHVNDPTNPAEDLKIYSSTANVTMNPNMIANTGGGQAHSIMNPYLTLRACIALVGIYPSRS